MAFGKDPDSLSAADGERSDRPWIIYLNGGYVLRYFKFNIRYSISK
jgi:hypothetical protein